VSEREHEEEQFVSEQLPTVNKLLMPPTSPRVPQRHSTVDQQVESKEHVACIDGIANQGKGFEPPTSQSKCKEEQSTPLLSRRGGKAPLSLQIDNCRSGKAPLPLQIDNCSNPKQKPSREAKRASSGRLCLPAETGTPAISVFHPDEGQVSSKSATAASEPLTLPAQTTMGTATALTCTPALRDLRNSSLMRRRGVSGSAVTKNCERPSEQALCAATAAPQQQAAQTGTATPATGSPDAVEAPEQATRECGLQPRPPPEDLRRPLKERPKPRRRVWNPLA